MKPIKSLLVLASLLVPGAAAAQGYYGGSGPGYGPPPPTQLPGGFHNRTGRLAWGVGLSLGGMHDRGSEITTCGNCDFNPIAVAGHGHIGGFLTPRFALMAEGQVNAQTVSVDPFYGDDTVLSQSALMIAGQLWVTPQLWIKGGIGFAHLYADNSWEGWDLGSGAALLGAAGYEVMSARNFSVDLQARLIQGTYESFDTVTSGTVGVGINWF